MSKESWQRNALAVSGFGLFSQSCALSAVVLVPPAIGAALGVDRAQLQWIGDTFLLTVGSLILMAGSLVDRLGPKRVFFWGSLLFGLGGLLSALSQSRPELIAARAVQGLGSAGLVPAGLGMVARAYSDGPSRGLAVGTWIASAGLSLVVGPLGAGALVTAYGWPSAFFALADLGLIGAVAVAALPDMPGSLDLPFDIAGQILIATALFTTIALLIGTGNRMDWSQALYALGAGAVLGGAFLMTERLVAHSLLPSDILRSLRYLLPVSLLCALFISVDGFDLYNALFLQQIQGRSALAVATLLLAAAVPVILLSPQSGLLVGRMARYISVAGGFVCVAGGLKMLSTAGPAASGICLELAYLLIGSGLGLANSPLLITLAITAVPVAGAGIASGVAQAASLAGGVCGIGLTGAVTASWAESWLRQHAAEGSFTGSMLKEAAGGSITSGPPPRLIAEAFTHGLHAAYSGAVLLAAIAAAVAAGAALRERNRFQSETTGPANVGYALPQGELAP
ncbi:MFS transporter [Streptomyces sp. NPDC127051]|uniref:MFS transporter n=1 Tax=Streptomyces sp. NPDC127051 TaxID=3347119 RepID=UPI0036622C8E